MQVMRIQSRIVATAGTKIGNGCAFKRAPILSSDPDTKRNRNRFNGSLANAHSHRLKSSRMPERLRIRMQADQSAGERISSNSSSLVSTIWQSVLNHSSPIQLRTEQRIGRKECERSRPLPPQFRQSQKRRQQSPKLRK